MNNSVFITAQTPTAVILQNILALLGILAKRAIRATFKAMATARIWLNTKHTFFDDGDPVVCTGWQFVGIGALSVAVTFLLGIDYSSLFA